MRRMRNRYCKFVILLVLTSIFCAGCAIYDPKRGVFVSSSIQDVDLKVSSEDSTKLVLLPFGAPKESIVGHVTNENFVSGVYVAANFTYVFDEVDQNNLRLSLVRSLNKSGIANIHNAKSMTEIGDGATFKAHIEFNRSGIVPGALVSKCIIDAYVLIERGSKQVTRARVSVEGTSAFSIANAKNDAIRLFVREFAGLL